MKFALPGKYLFQVDADHGLPLMKFCGVGIVYEFATQLDALVCSHPTL
jgi:hypothetical protein